MSTDIGHKSEPSVTALASGIASDTLTLVEQHIQLLKREVAEELHKVKLATFWFSVGVALAGLSTIFLLLMLVYVLHSFAEVPLWASFGITGAALAGVGTILLLIGYRKAADVHLVPPHTADLLKENLTWLKTQTISSNGSQIPIPPRHQTA